MKIIPLTMGLYTVVNDEDFDFLAQWHWYAVNFRPAASGRPPRFYAARGGPDGGHIKMANEIWIRHYGELPEGHVIDHVNNLSLDNRLWVDDKHQLESITSAENTRRSHIISPRRGKKKQQEIICAPNTSTEP